MQLVKKTQKDWECSRCLSKIEVGSSMIRNNINRWKTEVYCLECAKSDIEQKIINSKKSVKIFEEFGSNNMMYISSKQAVDYYKNVLKVINEKGE